MNPSNTNAGGWDASQMRVFINARMPNALPTVWRTMLKQVKISATEGSQSNNILVSDDYFYIPCLTELGGSNSSPYTVEGSTISWFTSAPANSKRGTPGGSYNTDIVRAKFRGMIIPEDVTYYADSSDPSLVSTYHITSGDVWKENGNSRCYIYATDEEIAYYGLSKTDGKSASIGGYWISAYGWWERSPYVGNTLTFWIVNTNGGTNGTNSASTSYGVCPCFSI